MANASPSFSSSDSNHELQRKVRNHEVAIAELKSLPSSRSVYQKCGNIYFRKEDAKAAMASEQEKLELVRAQLQKQSTT